MAYNIFHTMQYLVVGQIFGRGQKFSAPNLKQKKSMQELSKIVHYFCDKVIKIWCKQYYLDAKLGMYLALPFFCIFKLCDFQIKLFNILANAMNHNSNSSLYKKKDFTRFISSKLSSKQAHTYFQHAYSVWTFQQYGLRSFKFVDTFNFESCV